MRRSVKINEQICIIEERLTRTLLERMNSLRHEIGKALTEINENIQLNTSRNYTNRIDVLNRIESTNNEVERVKRSLSLMADSLSACNKTILMCAESIDSLSLKIDSKVIDKMISLQGALIEGNVLKVYDEIKGVSNTFSDYSTAINCIRDEIKSIEKNISSVTTEIINIETKQIDADGKIERANELILELNSMIDTLSASSTEHEQKSALYVDKIISIINNWRVESNSALEEKSSATLDNIAQIVNMIETLNNQLLGINTSIIAQNDLSTEQKSEIIELLSERLVCLGRELESGFTQLVDSQNVLINQGLNDNKNISETIRKIKNVVNMLPQKVVYCNVYERTMIEEYRNIQSAPDFKERFLNLMRGLDAEDKETVSKILMRQQKVLNAKSGANLDLYSEEEMAKIRQMKKEQENAIVQVADDLYCYKNYMLPINRFETSIFWDRHGVDRLKKSSIQHIKGRTIIDVGAYVGDSALIFSPMTTKKVISFEADLNNYLLMLKTFEINSVRNCIAENIALTDHDGEAVVYVYGSGSALHERHELNLVENRNVVATTLDKYVETNGIEVGLIKVDIEGGEQQFLLGAENTIKQQRPVLLISIYHNVNDFFSIKPLIENWNLGYKFKIHKPIDYTISREVLLIAEQ